MSDAYMGEIRIFAGTYAPESWLICNGSLLQISEYSALYALLGTLYGGDGVKTFGLPDLRGRLPISQGQGPGLSPRVPGQSGGTETVAMTSDQAPVHTHNIQAAATPATTATAGPGVTFATVSTSVVGNSDVRYLPSTGTPGAKGTLNGASLSTVGGQAHNNVMPVFALNYIICTVGIYPTSN